jgi:hypothetical protein
MTAGVVGTGRRSLGLVSRIIIFHHLIKYSPCLIGSLLETSLIKALEMLSKQHKTVDDFTAMFPPDTIQQWKCMVKEWEANSSWPNPYVSKDHGRLFCFTSSATAYSNIISFKSL